MKLTENQIKLIFNLHNKGYSNRYIAETVLGRKSRQSTVNDLLKSLKHNKYSIKLPKILFLDIETAPCLGYYWSRWKTNIGQPQVVSESFIISYSYKLLSDVHVYHDVLTKEEIINEDDSRLVKNLHTILSNIEICVAHNGINFDIPIIQTRMLLHGLNEPLPYKVIDTLKIAKRYFRFPSNSLSSLAIYLNLTFKTSPEGGFNLWKGFLKGDDECIKKMVEYNINDVVVLEELYLKLRPWDRLHPNLGLYNPQEAICPACGSININKMDKLTHTTVSSFITYKCTDCGKNFRDRKSSNNKDKLFSNIQ